MFFIHASYLQKIAMHAREYQLMIMESAGGDVRRMRIRRRSIATAVAAALTVTTLTVAMFVHSLVLRSTVEESERIREENETIRQVLADVGGALPDLEREALRSEMAFTQVWAKSGLGKGPSLLGVGPLEEQRAEVPSQLAATGVNGVDPLALGLEIDRLSADAGNIRETLSNLVDYFNDAEQILANTPSVRPSNSPWMTSGFGPRRDPVDGRLMMHKGLDIGGAIGSHIVAPADGVVIFAGSRGGYGRTLVVDHGYGYQTHFAHLSAFAVSVGDRVSRGQLMAYMGSTGKSTGPHLHYEVRLHGRPLDPMRFILD
ncbi:MAG: M23 family metallopeptidase [Myxococcota bacterium]